MDHSKRLNTYSRRELLKTAVRSTSGITVAGLFQPLIGENIESFAHPENPPIPQQQGNR